METWNHSVSLSALPSLQNYPALFLTNFSAPIGDLIYQLASNITLSDFLVYYGIVLGCLTMVANAVTIATIKYTGLGDDNNRFILITSLSVANFIVGVSVTLLGVRRLVTDFHHADRLCLVAMPATAIGAQLTSYNFLALTIDQYLVLTLHMRYVTMVTRRRVLFGVASIWLTVALTLMTMMMVWDYDKPCSYFFNVPMWLQIFHIVIDLFIPTIFIINLQVANIRLAKRHVQQICVEEARSSSQQQTRDQTAPNEAGNHGNHSARRHLRGVLINCLLHMSEFLAWLPNSITMLGYAADPSLFLSSPFRRFTQVSVGMYATCGLWVPILYGFIVKDIKTTWKKLLGKCSQQDS